MIQAGEPTRTRPVSPVTDLDHQDAPLRRLDDEETEAEEATFVVPPPPPPFPRIFPGL